MVVLHWELHANQLLKTRVPATQLAAFGPSTLTVPTGKRTRTGAAFAARSTTHQ